MHRLVVWILILHTLHAPVLMPDTDGECRGTPIESLIESQAWHPVLLGIRPNDDIDRGPIRADDERETPFDGSQFGELAILRGYSADWSANIGHLTAIPWNEGIRVSSPAASTRPAESPQHLAGRSVCVCFCVWRI